MAFLLEVSALAEGAEVPKYRTFSLWRAAYSLDGYGTTIDRWLDGSATDSDLDYLPSSRIREYLENIRQTGRILNFSLMAANVLRAVCGSDRCAASGRARLH